MHYAMWRFLRGRKPTTPTDSESALSVPEALLSEQPSDIFVRWALDGRLRGLLPDLDALRGISQAPAHRDREAATGDEVSLETLDALKPATLRSTEAPDYLYLLMPVRVS